MKERELILMQKRVDQLGAVCQKLINELSNLKDLSVGTMELVKRLPDYEVALNKLTEEHGKKQKDTSGNSTGDSGFTHSDE